MVVRGQPRIVKLCRQRNHRPQLALGLAAHAIARVLELPPARKRVDAAVLLERIRHPDAPVDLPSHRARCYNQAKNNCHKQRNHRKHDKKHHHHPKHDGKDKPRLATRTPPSPPAVAIAAHGLCRGLPLLLPLLLPPFFTHRATVH
eukprot:3929969-Rhodomonas_salina.1